MSEVIKFGKYSFSFPITKESEICKDSWGEDITDSLDKLNDNAFCKSYLYKTKELTTYESCKIEGAIELSTVGEKIIKELYDYESDVTKCITEINEIIDEQQKKDEAIISAYKEVKNAETQHRMMTDALANYENIKMENSAYFADKEQAIENAKSDYFSEKKTYDAAVEKAISKFLSAKTMPPSIGYDDLTMSR